MQSIPPSPSCPGMEKAWGCWWGTSGVYTTPASQPWEPDQRRKAKDPSLHTSVLRERHTVTAAVIASSAQGFHYRTQTTSDSWRKISESRNPPPLPYLRCQEELLERTQNAVHSGSFPLLLGHRKACIHLWTGLVQIRYFTWPSLQLVRWKDFYIQRIQAERINILSGATHQ